MQKLRTVDLFSGIGGFARGLEATGFFETTCFVETEPYCQAVLRQYWPRTPILGDIRNVRRADFPDPDPDVVVGGFPCQPFSHAGHQRGADDPRHLWPEMLRIIGELRPTWVIGENVIGLTNLGLDEVLSGLEAEGYATRTFNIPACAVGAPHIRQRLWIVAHADSQSEPDQPLDGDAGAGQLGFGFMADPDSDDGRGGCGPESFDGRTRLEHGGGGSQRTVADPHGQRPQGQRPDGGEEGRQDQGRHAELRSGAVLADPSQPEVLRQEDGTSGAEGIAANGGRPEEWWDVEPSVGRVADGIPARVLRLRALGNSIVPQIATQIGHALKVAHDWDGDIWKGDRQ